MYGFREKVTKVHLSPDEPEKFYQMLVTRMVAIMINERDCQKEQSRLFVFY